MSNVENLSPQIIRGIIKELHELTENPPEGIRVVINEADISDIQAFVEGPGDEHFMQFNVCTEQELLMNFSSGA